MCFPFTFHKKKGHVLVKKKIKKYFCRRFNFCINSPVSNKYPEKGFQCGHIS